MIKYLKKYPKYLLSIFLLLVIIYWFSLPSPLFKDPTCVVLEDKNGNLLGAKIANDYQWRFPHSDSIPLKFEKAILEFEDRRFYSHPGFDPIGFGRAIKQNFSAGRIVSGGSTISMQVMRMALKAKSRNVFQKLLEVILATRLELSYSKKEILAFYASNAPFGGNIVGLEAASWRYFGKSPQLLSWAEAATLAVLPNSPALIHPGRNRAALKAKRNRLLKRLYEKGMLDKFSYELALEEALPDKPHPLPRNTPHLLEKIRMEKGSLETGRQSAKFKTTINGNLQKKIEHILKRNGNILKANEIHNVAALVVEISSGDVIAYHGNLKSTGENHGEAVNIIHARRSSGSILKPLLYAFMLEDGMILPNSLVNDVPTKMGGYQPKNYYEDYDGMIPASKALTRSLNVPFIRLLQNYGLEKFHLKLKQMGFHSINKSPDWYGLPLILGGAEVSLWEVTNAYANMARILNSYNSTDGEYFSSDWSELNYLAKVPTGAMEKEKQKNPGYFSASSLWQTFETIRNLERPSSEGEWEHFQSSQKIAWKTGTSFGFRDAWAVGVTPKYAIGVWVGNADGEGRPGLVGVKAAAPVLFDILDVLPSSNWFLTPHDDLVEAEVCTISGFKATENCQKEIQLIGKKGLNSKLCSFHKIIHLNDSEEWQVNGKCESPSNMVHKSWFVLPPLEEHYYKIKNPNYVDLPPFKSDCNNLEQEERTMQLIYPKDPTKIYVPIDLDGEKSRTVFKVAHRNPETSIYWHLDNEYLGTTKTFHNFELAPNPGKHQLTLVDQNGNQIIKNFEIIGKEREN